MPQPPPLPHSLPDAVPIAEPISAAEALPLAQAAPDRADYHYASFRAGDFRPGGVTTLGVGSLVIAVGQVGYAATICLLAFMFLIISAVTPRTTMTSVATMTPQMATASSPDGLDMAERRAIAGPLIDLAHLNKARADGLEALLAEHGRDIAPNLIRPMASADRVRKYVSRVSRTADGADLIETSTGRFQLTDLEASFEPENSNDAIVLNFTTASVKPGETAFDPGGGAASTQPAIAVSAGPPMVTPRPMLPVSDALVATIFLSAAAAACLAILLFVAGILTLLGRRAGRWTHLIWAWLKLPVAIIGAISTTGFLLYFADADAASTGMPRDGFATFFSYVCGILQGLMSLAYIVAVIVVMRAPRVRAWFAPHA